MNPVPEKQRKILKSATAVFSGKGFSNATISEIAKGAGLTSSGIYIYYKSKEELLFKIIENFLVKSCNGLSDHLQGIIGADNKLRKAIWFHCKAYSGNKDEIKIVLEARSYPLFYSSNAYKVLRQYADFFTQIISEGMEQGIFKSLESPMILRDLILGTVDHIAINWTLKNEPNSLAQSEEIFNMVMRAVQPLQDSQPRPDKKQEKRKRIIDSAIEIFAQKGFNRSSMLEIARKSKVAEGTVYDYFGTKEQLLVSIPGEKLGLLYDQLRGRAPDLKIRNTISGIFEFYYQEKGYATILVLMLRTNPKFHESMSNRIMEKLFMLIQNEIKKGQEQKIFRQDLDMNICRNLLFGTLDHIMIPMIIFNREYDLKSVGRQVSDLFINAIQSHGGAWH